VVAMVFWMVAILLMGCSMVFWMVAKVFCVFLGGC